MYATLKKNCRSSRTAISAAELFWIILIIALLIAILLPSLSRARELAKRPRYAIAARSMYSGVGPFVGLFDLRLAMVLFTHFASPNRALSTHGPPCGRRCRVVETDKRIVPS